MEQLRTYLYKLWANVIDEMGIDDSATILLHPFVQMPRGWGQNHREANQEPIYPTDEEIYAEV